MENHIYPLYELPEIADLKDLLLQKSAGIPEETAFEFLLNGKVVCKSYQDFYYDVTHTSQPDISSELWF